MNCPDICHHFGVIDPTSLSFFELCLKYIFFLTVLDPHPCQVSQMKSVWPDSSKGGWYEKPEPQCSGNDSSTIQKDFEGWFFSEIFWASVKDSIIFKVIKQPHMECCWSLSMYLQCCSLESHRLGQPHHVFHWGEERATSDSSLSPTRPKEIRFVNCTNCFSKLALKDHIYVQFLNLEFISSGPGLLCI